MMALKSFHNHELDPDTRALVASLSDNQAVGAWIARQDGQVCVCPVGAAELLADEWEDYYKSWAAEAVKA